MKLKTLISNIIFSNKYLRHIRIYLGLKLNHFPLCKHLADSTNVLHIGGNTGQERYIYEYFSINVAFIEPIPDVFRQLNENLKYFDNQKAFNFLFWRSTGKTLELNIANNNGSSSSLYELDQHKILWPQVNFIDKIAIKTISADDFVNLKCWGFIPDTIVMDTQGAELEILRGAEKLLSFVKYIRIEAADFESYKGGCTLNDLELYLKKYNFFLKDKEVVKEVKGFGGRYYEVLFERVI